MIKYSIHTIKSDSLASNILDVLRFISALTVFLFHFYVPLPGYQAVMVFFILSGYFISGTILNSIREKRWNWIDYLLKRIIRLWVVLIPCLILTFIWAKFQLSFFGSNQKIAHFLDFKIFMGNLFFLQGILVKNYGLNGPLWSLSYEFWYYILFPCLVLTISSRKKLHKLLYLLLFIGISIFVGKRIMLYFLIWLLGAIIPLIKPINFKNHLIEKMILMVSILIALISTQYKSGNWEVNWSNYVPDMRVGVAFFFLIYLIVSFYNNKLSNKKIGIHKQLAGFSYTLYLAHYPIANFILTWLMTPLWPFGQTTLLFKVTLAFIVLLYSWILSLLTEKHTDKVRRVIFKNIFNKKSFFIKYSKTIKNKTSLSKF